MSDAAVPLTLAGKVYHLRYTYPDFVQMEAALKMKYKHFIEDEIFQSMTAQGAYLWCGLKKELQENGRWVHIFPQTPEGLEQAGALLWEHVTATGNPIEVSNAIFEAFVTTGPWKRADPKTPEPKERKPQKNSKT
jgi:hypothetical protein